MVVHISSAEPIPKPRWEFNDLKAWRDDSQNNSPKSYAVSEGRLRIATRKETRDRVKIRTIRRFGAGRYTWRIFVPAMGTGDQASIGAFLYRDDKHEVDFEIGFGTAKLREKLKAKDDDLVCYCTSQGFPYSSSQLLVKRETWHTFSIIIAPDKDGHFKITWFVDGKQTKQLQTSFGNEISFTVHCSVENLTFIGDHIPTQENYALFDYVDFVAGLVPAQIK